MPLYIDNPNGSADNDFLLGAFDNHSNVAYAGAGNDVIYGGFGPIFSGLNPTAATAYSINGPTNALVWNRQENRDIINSTTVSHTTIIPTQFGGTQNWFSVTVVAGQTITLDVDYGFDTNNSDTDTVLRIYQSNGTTLLAQNDDAATLDIGSTSIADSNLTYTFAAAGTYLVNISEAAFFGGDNDVFEDTDEFMLHVSLTGQAFVADPLPSDDIIYGESGDDVLYGFSGDDLLNGGAGADVLNGGAGFDTATYQTAAAGVYARLDGVTGAGGEAVGDTFFSIEALRGSSFADILVGRDISDIASADFLYGGGGNDTLYGLNGNDNLSGEEGNDTLYGGEGNDDLTGGIGGDTLDGGAGTQDSASYREASSGVYARLDGVAGSYGEAVGDVFISIERFFGSNFADTFVGNSANNEFFGLVGSDSLYGLGGDDTLIGGTGDDNLYGGIGGDNLNGGDGLDTASYNAAASGVYVRLDGVAGASGEAIGDTFVSIEVLDGSAFADILVGSNYSDGLFGNGGDDQLYGLNGNDRLTGGIGADVLNGGDAIDTASYNGAASGVYARLDGVAGASGEAIGDTFVSIEALDGSAFADTLVGSADFNVIYGRNGNDSLYGLDGTDYLDGNDGNDQLYGGVGGDTLNGGDGIDTARYDGATSGVYLRLDGVAGSYGEAAGDTFSSIEGVVGSYYNDIIVGSANMDYTYGLGGDDYLYGIGGNDTLDGGAGNDNLFGGIGADSLNGGDGFDLARYDSASSAIYARLDGVAGQAGEAVGDTYVSIESLVGSAFNDTFVGSANADYLFGLGGYDALYGLGGADYIDGGGGNDTLFGGAGADRFVFSTALNSSTNVDTISDFQTNVDDIVLSQAIFAGFGTTLDATEFKPGSADATTDRILYFSSTGEIYYDDDGNGSSSAFLVAIVTPGTALTIADFVMVA